MGLVLGQKQKHNPWYVLIDSRVSFVRQCGMLLEDLSGKKFGRLEVLEFSHERRSPCGKIKHYWKCRCDCGALKVIQGHSLRSGNTKSCSCLSKEINALKNTRHGMGKRCGRHPMYQTWQNMIARCGNPRATGYKWYGKRGIKVCEQWHRFEAFMEDMIATWREGLSIDRINNAGDYCPENCRWVTWDIQVINRRKKGSLTHD